MNRELQDAFCGGLIGTFCGDALGMPFEGWPPEMIEREIGVVERMYEARLGAGTYTDDTQMMIALGESLVEKKGFDGEDMALKMASAYDPKRGYGKGTQRALERIKRGVDWDRAAKGLFPGGSYGNGAAMRIAPVGLLYFDDAKRRCSAAKTSSIITNIHPLGLGGALLQAEGVALALTMGSAKELNQEVFLRELRECLATFDRRKGEWERRLMLVEDLLENLKRGHPLPKAEVARTLGNDTSAHGSVPAAIYAFLAHPYSFKEALSYAVGLGGDTDTIGAMTGALSGSFHGMKGIPKEWLESLEKGEKGEKGIEYVVELAHKLLMVREDL